ncbi:MAG: TRAP transporter small permease [Succinatimonas sp.]|nr:TRAP transporter small permease [Succinatimonas sp.]
MLNSKVLRNLDLIIAGCALAVLVIVATLTVISRYIVNSPIMWSEEIQILCFMWISFLGAGAAFRYGAHVSIEFLVDLLPHKISRIVELFIGLLVTILLVYIAYLSIVYIGQSILLNKVSTILKIPDYVFCSSLFVGLICMIIGNTTTVINKFKTPKNCQEKD